MGEYVTRIYDQVRNRPGFVVQHSRNVEFNTNERRRSTPEFVPSQISMTNSELRAHELATLASDSRLLEDIQALLDDVARTRSESPRTDKKIFPVVTPGGFASGTSNSLNL